MLRALSACLLLCLMGPAIAFGGEDVTPALPFAPLPAVIINESGSFTPNAAGVFEWLGQDAYQSATGTRCPVNPTTLDSWHPVTGELVQRPINTEGYAGSLLVWQARLATGIVGFWTIDCGERQAAWFGFVGNDGKVLKQDAEHWPKLSYDSRTVVLSATTLAHVWHTTDDQYLHAEIIRVQGDTIQIQAIPDLKIAYRKDYGLAAYGPDRLMVLGGSGEPYRGCETCRDETHVFDLTTGQWSDGPKMLEGRSELNARALPDGSVLVSGGYTPNAGWRKGPSRTAERLSLTTHRFEPAAPMPSPNAKHTAIDLPGRDGQVMMIGGSSGNIVSYESANDTWHVLATCRGPCNVFPFRAAGRLYGWAESRPEDDQSYSGRRSLKPIALRQLASDHPAAVTVAPQLLSLGRQGVTFLPSTATLPAMVISGSGLSVADTIDTQGRMASVQPMLAPHYQAVALRFNGGVIVYGGDRNDGRAPPKEPPIEWLPPDNASGPALWQAIAGTPPSYISAVASLANGNLVEVNEAGEINELSLDTRQSPAMLTRTAWPVPRHLRKPTDINPMEIRQLDDGRVVFAAGETQPVGMTLLKPDSGQPNARDEVQYLGEFNSAGTYAIFNPRNQLWIESAPEPYDKVTTFILADGRVARFGQPLPGAGLAASPPMRLSTVDGRRWTSPEPTGLPVAKDDRAYFNMSDDLVMKEWRVEPDSKNGGHYILEWFDLTTSTWTTVLDMDGFDPEYQAVTLPNGHTFVLDRHR